MENQRTRLSKMMLKDALMELLKDKSLEEISILAICDKAQINRTTFYRHYGCQNDLFNEIVDDYVDGFRHYVENETRPNVMLERAMEYVSRQREKLALLVDSMSDALFTKAFFDDPTIDKLINKGFENSVPSNLRSYKKTFYSYGIYALVKNWLNNGCKETPKEIADIILSLYNKVK